MRPAIPPVEDFGTRFDAADLRSWRAARRVSQAALALILGVSRITVSNWETGVVNPPPFLHLTLESVDRRLSFGRVPDLPTRHLKPRPAFTAPRGELQDRAGESRL